MPLELVTHLSDLNQSNPPGTDTKAQGDDHIRNIKLALRTDFPNINGVVNATPAQLNLLNSIAALTVLANATNGAAAPTALAAASDGQVLRRASSLLAFGSIDDTNAAAVSNPVQRGYNSATQAFTTTAFVDITGHTGFNLVAGAYYEFECNLWLVSGSTGGFSFQGVFSNSPQTAFAAGVYGNPSVGGNIPIADFLAGAVGFAVNPIGAGSNMMYSIRGVILANAVTGGTFKLQGKQSTAVGTTTLQIGGLTKLQRVA